MHTLDLPNGNRTSDEEINRFSINNKATLITNDADFVSSFILQRYPYKLLLVSTGNITNIALENLFKSNLDLIIDLFQSHDFIEITLSGLVLHS